MADLNDLLSEFAPSGFIEYHFGGGEGSGKLFYKASATGADNTFDLKAINAFGTDITDSLAPEAFQRAHEAIVASESNKE